MELAAGARYAEPAGCAGSICPAPSFGRTYGYLADRPETQTCVKLRARLHVVAPQCHEHHRIRRSHAHHRAYREARGAAFPPYSTIWLMR